jgi:hypothetical protein
MIQTMPTAAQCLSKDRQSLCLDQNGMHVCERARGHGGLHACMTEATIFSWVHARGAVLTAARSAVGSDHE